MRILFNAMAVPVLSSLIVASAAAQDSAAIDQNKPRLLFGDYNDHPGSIQDGSAPFVENDPNAPMMEWYSALIDMGNHHLVKCAGLKISTRPVMQISGLARDKIVPGLLTTSRELVDLLRPAQDNKPDGNMLSYGSCMPYQIDNPEVIQGLQRQDTLPLAEYTDGSGFDVARIGLMNEARADINPMLNVEMITDPGMFPRDAVVADPVNIPQNIIPALGDDDVTVFRLSAPACLNTGFNDAIAKAVRDSRQTINPGPLPDTIPLRKCTPQPK